MRPDLTTDIAPERFLAFYWLKAELVAFCRANGLATSGSKQALQARIAHFLATGEKLAPTVASINTQSSVDQPITLTARIPRNYKNDQRHRAFFTSVIGARFKFNVVFMNWMKANAGKTYQEAVNEWLRIDAEKKAGKKQAIGKQFEYNQYMRDFFAANPDQSRENAIRCWRYKKSIAGSNKYDASDLEVLNQMNASG